MLSDKINDIKRKRKAAQDDIEQGRGVKKARDLFKALVPSYEETPPPGPPVSISIFIIAKLYQ